jgi:GAF domain-containing protein
MRSEAALPLRARGQVLGVLDVQSQASEALDAEQLAVLQTLADQIALAISNARLFEQVQASAEAERRAYGELSRQAWAELTRARLMGYHYDEQGVVPLTAPALRVSQPDNDQRTLAVPLSVRGQTIGALNASKPGGEWTQEEAALLQTLAEQLGTALDSARLYQDTQRRAAQERLIGEATSRMRESLDIERVLQTAAEELYQALGLEEMAISLTPELDSAALGTTAPPRTSSESGNGSNR